MEIIVYRPESENGILELISYEPELNRYGVSVLKGSTQKEMIQLLQNAQDQLNTWIVNQVTDIKEAKASLKADLCFYKDNKINYKQLEQLLNNGSIMLSNKPVTID